MLLFSFLSANPLIADFRSLSPYLKLYDLGPVETKLVIPLPEFPILEWILKRNGMTKYKGSMYYIYFKLSGKSFPHITTKEYNSILNVFDVMSSIYDKYKPKGRKSFLNYHFVLKQIQIMRVWFNMLSTYPS